jgi:Tfp pilus assembly protein PilO
MEVVLWAGGLIASILGVLYWRLWDSQAREVAEVRRSIEELRREQRQLELTVTALTATGLAERLAKLEDKLDALIARFERAMSKVT